MPFHLLSTKTMYYVGEGHLVHESAQSSQDEPSKTLVLLKPNQYNHDQAPRITLTFPADTLPKGLEDISTTRSCDVLGLFLHTQASQQT